jgi:hypothetical protein
MNQKAKPYKMNPELAHFSALHHTWLTLYYHYRFTCWDSPSNEARKKTNSSALRAVERAMKDHQARFPEIIGMDRLETLERVRLALKTDYQLEQNRRDRLFLRHVFREP